VGPSGQAGLLLLLLHGPLGGLLAGFLGLGGLGARCRRPGGCGAAPRLVRSLDHLLNLAGGVLGGLLGPLAQVSQAVPDLLLGLGVADLVDQLLRLGPDVLTGLLDVLPGALE